MYAALLQALLSEGDTAVLHEGQFREEHAVHTFGVDLVKVSTDGPALLGRPRRVVPLANPHWRFRLRFVLRTRTYAAARRCVESHLKC